MQVSFRTLSRSVRLFTDIYIPSQKNLPSEVMTFFIFSQTVENFYIDFYAPITRSYLR